VIPSFMDQGEINIMNYRTKSLLFIIFFVSFLFIYQNCGGGLQTLPPSGGSTISKSYVDSSRYKIGDLTVDKSRISSQTQTQNQVTTTTSIVSNTANSESNFKEIPYYQIKLWPMGELIYKFDPSLNSKEKDLFRNACAEWESATQAYVKCIPLSASANLSGGYLLVSFLTTGECYADLGASSGVSKLVLTEACATSAKLTHLLGHSFGLIDQHLRADRNEFVTVPATGAETSNYAQFKSTNFNSPTYDFASVMNHPFNSNYKALDGKIPQTVNVNGVGLLGTISESDKSFLNRMYSTIIITSGSGSGGGSVNCTDEQLVTWGFGCYYHILANNPAKTNGFVLPAFNNQNPEFETNNKSQAQVKCVNGSWELQSAQCSNLPGVTTGTSTLTCAQNTLQWKGTSANSLCYLTTPQSLPQSAALGTIFEVSVNMNNQPMGFGIFACEKNSSTGIVDWINKSTLTYKRGGDRYSQTRSSFCYTNQNNIDQCPSGMSFSWKSISGNNCSGTTPNPMTIGSKWSIMATSGTWGWVRVTCIKDVATGHKIFADTSEDVDMGYCGHSGTNPAAVDLSDGKITKLAKCLPIQKLMNWRDNYNGQECSSTVTISDSYFEGQPFIYQNNLEGNSFNSMVALRCKKDASGAGIWENTTLTEVNNSAGFLPPPVCKKACLPPTQLSWTNTESTYTCWGVPPQDRKYIEGEKETLKPTNLDATPDSQAEFQCSTNGLLNKTQSSSNKCAH
jgi:hypothetical protein